MNNNHTIIIGGGITGMSLALLLAKNKMPVTVVDIKSCLDEPQWQQKLNNRDARVYALSISSIALLKQIGTWPIIEAMERKVDYTQMHVWQQDGVGDIKFAEDDNTQLLGSMVEPSVIEYALHQTAKQAKFAPYVTQVFGHEVTNIDWLGKEQGYKVYLDTGQSLQAKLLIGADGRASKVRELAGIGLAQLSYKQTAICCAIKTQKPHSNTARQAMLPTGTLALLPLADMTLDDKKDPQHWQSVVWTLPTYDALALLHQGNEQIAQALMFASGYELGEILQIESVASFPLTAQQAKTYIQPNLALVGDAAHGVHPLAGQGLNLGMLDVEYLCKLLLADYQRSGQKAWAHDSTLKRYEWIRKTNNSMMMHSFSFINWAFAGYLAQNPKFGLIRNTVVSKVANSRTILQWLNQKANGL